MAKAAELDTELVTGLKAAKSKRAYFALVLKGGKDGALIVSKTKVPPTVIAEAKKKSGGSAVLKGFCQYEEGTYIFETAKEAPATASQAVKLIVKRDAGLAVKAEFRVNADRELLADDGEATPPAAPPQPAQDGAELIKRLNAMNADIKSALAGPNKANVQSLVVAVGNQIKNKDFAQAGKGLDELALLVKQAKPGAPPSNGAELTKRLNAMSADIKAALAGPNKARVQSLYVAVSGQIKNKGFDQAGKVLDELELLVSKAGAAQSPPSPAALKAAAVKRLNAMSAGIKAALAANGPNAARIKSLFAAANGLMKVEDFVQANKVLDELEPLVKPSSAADGGAAGAKATATPERWRGARQRWEEANSAVDGQIAALQAALRQTGEPTMKEIAEFGVNGLTGDNKAKLIATLFELGDGASSAMQKAGPKALKIILGFRKHLDSDERIEVCDDNPFDVPVSIRATLGGALAEMQDAIEAALAAQPAAV